MASDQLMKTDWDTGPDLRFYLYRENDGKALSVEVRIYRLTRTRLDIG